MMTWLRQCQTILEIWRAHKCRQTRNCNFHERYKMSERLTGETKCTNGKYVVAMLWKGSCEELPDNYQIALRRLKLV